LFGQFNRRFGGFCARVCKEKRINMRRNNRPKFFRQINEDTGVEDIHLAM